MKDDDLQELLQQVRPSDPRASLRARIVAASNQRRVWPWALAAAAVLAVTMSLQVSTARLYRQGGDSVGRVERPGDGLAALSAALNHDAALMQHALLWAAEERRVNPLAEEPVR